MCVCGIVAQFRLCPWTEHVRRVDGVTGLGWPFLPVVQNLH